MSSKFLSLLGLKEFIGQRNPIQSKDFLEQVAKFFDEILSKAELDHALEVLFDSNMGTLGFLLQSIKEAKAFTDSNTIIFNTWIKILQQYGKTINFELYVEGIIECCMKYIISNQVSAKEKEKATIVLQELFINKLTEPFDTSEVNQKLLDVFNLKNRPGSFAQQVFRLLGIIARDSTETVSDLQAIEIRDVMLKTLEEILLNEETIQFNILSGAMEGLNYYLINYLPDLNLESRVCDRIYVCVKKLSDPLESVKQKAPFRCALDLFTQHYTIFTTQLFRDYKYWHNCLKKWLGSHIYEDRKKGIYGTQAFHRAIENELVKRKITDDKLILEHFIEYFQQILESPSSKPYETRIAIRGFGVMALSCKMYLPHLLDSLLSLVIQRTELISIAEDNALRDSLEHFPDYIEALSQIIIHIDEYSISLHLSNSIQSILIRLIRDYHYLSRAHTSLVSNSICGALFNLSTLNGTLFDDVLNRIVLEGIIWTCSHKLVYDANLDWETETDWKENVTYKNYLPLWTELLSESLHGNQLSYDKPLVAKKIFDTLISTLFIILEKLDLRTKRRIFKSEDGTDQEFHFCDPNIDLCPQKPKDFHIFFNLVDLYKDIFYSNYRRKNFHKWIAEYSSKLIFFAIKNPLISGFLKLLEIGLSTADYLEYFKEITFDENEMLHNQLKYFLKVLIIKAQRTSGELQISMLQLILHFPVIFYQNHLFDLIEIFKISLKLGKSLTWLAKHAVNALDNISAVFSDNIENMKHFYEMVLPELDSYLQSKGIMDDVQAGFIQYKDRRRIKTSVLKKFESTELLEIQKLILNFLGKLDSHNAALLVSTNTSETLVKWNVEQNIFLKLNFPDMKPTLYLDTMVPRICQIAVESSDRKAKIAACELVHALVLYLLGTRTNSGSIWKELCSKLLILGVDSDSTVQQMFTPLLMQLMHFMSKIENINKGVDILMECLMDGISNSSTNCSIRDLSAVCLREFVEWSIKQTNPQQLAASSVSIEKILEQLKMYSFDSDNSRRIGASLAFNNLYRNLREEEIICNLYFIDLLYTFCCNFKLTEELSSTTINLHDSDLEQISSSLDHVLRVLKERCYLFLKPKWQRKIPIAIGCKESTLKEVVLFLLQESKSKLINYRRKCLNMVIELSQKVESSLSSFLNKYTTAEMLQKICRTKMQSRLPEEVNSQNPFLIVYTWLQYFLSSLDLYCWFLADIALPNPNILFINDSIIFETISYYFNDLCWKSMLEIVIQYNQDFLDQTTASIIDYNLEEIEKINSIKCIICIQILDFLYSVLHADCIKCIPENFWNQNSENLQKLLIQLIFEAHLMQFDFKSEEISKELPKRIEILWQTLNKYCSNEVFLNSFNNTIKKNLIDRFKNLTDHTQELLNSQQISETQLNSVNGIIFVIGKPDLYKIDCNTNIYLKVSAKKLLDDLFVGINDTVFGKKQTIKIIPEVKTFGNKIMSLVFKIGGVENEFISFLLNETEIIQSNTQTKIKYGEWFFNVYKRAIFEQCKKSFLEAFLPQLFDKIYSDNFHYILKIIMEIIEFTYKYRQHDQQTMISVVEISLNKIKYLINDQIYSNKNEVIVIMDLLNHLQMACPKTWTLKSYKDKCPDLQNWIINQLVVTETTLEHKTKIFSLLSLLINSDDFQNQAVTDGLENIQKNYFPLKSSEFKENSLEETKLKAAYKSLLDAMISSNSYILFDFIMKSTAADKKHLVEYMIRDDIKIFISKLTITQQTEIIKKVFDLVSVETMEPEIRLTLLRRFLVPVVENSSEDTVVSIYSTYFSKILHLTETNYGFANSGWLVNHALVHRIIGFSLIESFFVLLQKSTYLSAQSPIIQNAYPGEKTAGSFISKMSKKCFYSRKDIFITDNNETAEFFRLYQCSSFRALCSIVCNTQNELKFYSKFIFEENPKNKEYIWQKLIDCKSDSLYNFEEQEFENYPRVKQRFVSIRKINSNPIAISNGTTNSSSKYMRTQNVFSSSLSQDVSKIDLNYTMVRSDTEAMIRSEMQSQKILSVELERHNLNKHEVMPTLCGVIQHMYENEITPKVNDNSVKKSYAWVNSIAASMESFESHKNIRVFLVQLVDNCRHVFEPYAHVLFKPILEVLCDECAGSKLNFFVTDLVTLLLSWTSKGLYKPSTPDEIRLVSKLLYFFMKNAHHSSKKIFKFNLELIQTLISLWKNELTVPSQLLLEMISYTSLDSRANECGIVLLGIVLANEIIPWTDNLKILFIKAILTNLNNEYNSIYQPAAHVLGMILATLKRTGDTSNLESQQRNLVEKLRAMLNKRENKKEKSFLDILYGVHKNYPDIIDSFLETISFKIPTALAAIKRLYLEMLLTRLHVFSDDEIYNVVISIGILDLLKNADYQLLALHILNRSIVKLKPIQIERIFPSIEDCLTSTTKPESRDIIYEILIHISHLENFEKIPKRAKELLLKGLLDVNSQIQKRIYQFWSKESNLPAKTQDRILSLISNYNSGYEKQFLGFCGQLILEPAVQSSESKQQIFPFESDRDSKLEEYDINTSARLRSTFSLPPLFVESQRTVLAHTQMVGFIRTNTGDYFFEPTQDPAKMIEVRPNFTLQTQSSLPFGIQPQVLDRRSQKIHSTDKLPEIQNSDDILNMFRKRFIKDKEKENRESAIKAIDRRSKVNESIKRREGKVKLYRRYRFGDYPDLLINSLAFLLPLQGLIKRDMVLARQIFVSIFNAILSELSENDSNEFTSSVAEVIQKILESIKSCDSTVFATFLEISLLKPEVFDIKPETVSMISKASNMLTIGALYLENRINVGCFEEDDDRRSVRSTSTITKDDQHWLQLSDIYTSLAEYDIVAAIFGDKMQTDPRLSKAIELKANGMLKEAQELLLQVIHQNHLLEQYYAYDCYYQCFLELGDWTSLSQGIQHQIDDFEELWSDEYNTTYYLPKLMQAELNLILIGETSSEDFLKILENWMLDSVKSEYIKTKFCEEMMMLHIANRDFKQARVYGENNFKKFLIDWGTFNCYYFKLRKQTLLDTQKVAEIDQYAQMMLENFNDITIRKLNEKWMNCSIDITDSLSFWNSVLSYRTYVTALISDNLENFSTQNVQITKLKTTVYEMYLKYFEAAVAQKNYGICDNVLKILKPLENMELNLHYEVAQIKKNLLHAEKLKQPNLISVIEQGWFRSHKILNDRKILQSVPLHIEALFLNCRIGEEILKIHQNTTINIKIAENLKNLIAEKHGNADNFHDLFVKECIWSLKQSSNIMKQILNESETDFNEKSRKLYAENYFRIAQHCYENYEKENDEVSIELQKMLIESVFNAMKNNSSDARQLFGCVLQIPTLDGRFNDFFIEKSNDVPDWMFLSWIPQILSRIQLHVPSYLDNIVERLAKSYQNALKYPFNVWYAREKSNENETNYEGQRNTRLEILRIMELLKHPLTDKFILSIENFCLPSLSLVNKLYKIMQIKDINMIRDQLQYLCETFFKENTDFHGSIFRNILPIKPKLESLLQKDFQGQMKKFLLEIDKIREMLIVMTDGLIKSSSKRLDEISPWLSTFHWCGEEDYIELPGQYIEDKRPILENHIKIVKFGSKIEIFRSQRYPIRLTIYGSDAKKYDFLTKTGEDLRQDQRIQQILKLMSNKLKDDQQCRNHRLFIQNYNVIPINEYCGMLSWVPNTATMTDFISGCLVRRFSTNGITKLNQNRDKYKKFIEGAGGNNFNRNDALNHYGTAVANYTRENIINNYRELEYNIPAEIIKYGLAEVSVSPESFYVLRNNYATSLAAMNIAHWILGIGDRHLSNILISVNNGTLTGIDFGFVFGAGIRNQTVPELLPFRLTPHFVNAMNPMGVSGLIFKCMSHSLRVFRNSKKLLLATMEVFIREPTVDWLESKKKFDDDSDVSSNWEPKDRIDVSIRKLNGYNPVYLLRKELRSGKLALSNHQEYINGYEKLLIGHEQFNIRARLPHKDLGIEDQIKCLIDLATDPAVLGITWEGFMPWL